MHEPRRLKHPTRLPRKWKMTLKVSILTKKKQDPNPYNWDESKTNKGFLSQTEGKCHVSEKTSGDVISIDMHGDSRVAYFACKIFVKSSPFDRMGIIFEDFVENV